MVGITLFTKVDIRLRQIKEKPDELFGGLPIIVLGDFNQLTPVGDGKIFSLNPENPYASLTNVTNPQWDLFELFELTEIMRQREDLPFARALTKIGMHGLIALTSEEIKMFDSRIVSDPSEIPEDAIYLFYTNDDVEAHNQVKIKQMPGQLFTNVAQDVISGSDKHTHDARRFLENIRHLSRKETNYMPYELLLKRNAKYMITNNIDLNDGLVNGSCGILKKIVKNIQQTHAVLLWFQFQEEDMGRAARRKYKGKMAADGEVIREIDVENWTPFPTQSLSLNLAKRSVKWSVKRTQFQLIECEALTIHKSQGQTILREALNLLQSLTTALFYVALTRVQRLADLYLYGKSSIVDGCDFLKFNKETREKMVREAAKRNPRLREMRRLRRQKPMENIFSFLEEDADEDDDENELTSNKKTSFNTSNACSIIYQTVSNAGLQNNFDFISTDFGFMRADIILLGSCRTQPSQLMNLIRLMATS